MSEVESKHCGKMPLHDGHHWWGHRSLWSGPRPDYWCSGKRVAEGGFWFSADVWADGYDAGHADARAVQPTYPEPTPNPHGPVQ